jgi:Arc/MetJ-type ribon-helix-helix transcriptional regulator
MARKVQFSVRIPDDLLSWVDSKVEEKLFHNRTHAIIRALSELKEKMESG